MVSSVLFIQFFHKVKAKFVFFSRITLAVSGNFAYHVNTNGCEATSDCMAFILLATTNFDNGQFGFYPNPTTGQLYFTNNAIKVKTIWKHN
jgi:hypothetical protein